MTAARTIAASSAARAAPRAATAMAAGLGLAAVAVRAHPDTTADVVDTAVGWLHLPVWLTATAVVAATIDAHPAFGRDRADAPWIRRLRLGPLDGCGHAILAAIVVFGVVAALGGLAFERLVRSGPARPLVARTALAAVGDPRADPGSPRIELSAGGSVPATELELRPLVAMVQRGTVPTAHVRVLVDGRDATGFVELPPGGGLLRAPVATGHLARAALELEPGERAVVLLPDGAALAIAQTALGPDGNAALAAATAALSVALALSFAAAFRRRLALPVLHLTALGVLLLGPLSGLAPASRALAAHARGAMLWTVDTATSARNTAVAAILIVASAALAGRLRNR